MYNEIHLALYNPAGSGSNEGSLSIQNNESMPSNWSTPPQGFIKINVNDATKLVGVAATITRDQMGFLIEGLSKIIVGSTTEER